MSAAKKPSRIVRATEALLSPWPNVRHAFREMLGPWAASEWPTGTESSDLTRLVLDWVAACMSPDDETRGSTRKLRARARELHRNNGYVTSYVNLLTNNVIGPTGIGLQPKVRDNSGDLNKLINRKIADAWKAWAEGPVTADGRMNLTDYCSLALGSVGTDGESFTHFREGRDFEHGLALEGIDCDLVDEEYNRNERGLNEIRMGVEVNESGKPLKYHTRQDYPSLFGSGAKEREAIPAEDVIHMMRFRRVNQTRGVTWLGPTMIALRMLEGYEESELVAARIGASKMGFFKSQKPDVTSEFATNKTDAKAPILMEANPGTAEALPVGWEFQEWSPDHPTTAFPSFVKANLRKIATGLGVSYNALASDLEGVNYSSMRSGVLMERETWRKLQQWWIGQFMTRVYRRWLVSALTNDVITLDAREFKRFLMVKWNPRGWQWVDPKKDGEAAVIQIGSALNSRQRIVAERGDDWFEIAEELAEEAEEADTLGIDISGDTSKTTTDPEDDAEGNEGSDDENGNGNGRARKEVLAALRRERRG